MTPDDRTPSKADIQAEVARELLEVHLQNYGTGATEVQVLVEDDLVIVVLDVELTAAERTLLTAGEKDAVKVTREAFQQAIGPTFGAIVERATGRKVASFLSAMSIDPVYSVELFRLTPESA